MPAFLCRFHTFTDMSAQRMTRSAVQRGRVWRPGASPRWRERGGRCLVLRGFARSCGPRSYSRLSLLLVLVLAWQPPLDACHSRGCCPWLGSVWWRRPPCPRAWPPPAPGLCFWLLLNCPPPPLCRPGREPLSLFSSVTLGHWWPPFPSLAARDEVWGLGMPPPAGGSRGPGPHTADSSSRCRTRRMTPPSSSAGRLCPRPHRSQCPPAPAASASAAGAPGTFMVPGLRLSLGRRSPAPRPLHAAWPQPADRSALASATVPAPERGIRAEIRPPHPVLNVFCDLGQS